MGQHANQIQILLCIAVSLPYVKLRGNRGWIEQDVRLLP